MSTYSKSFKLKVVKAYLSQSMGQRQVATLFNVGRTQVRDWVAAYRAHGAAAFAARKHSQKYSTEFKLSVLAYLRQHGGSRLQVAIAFKIPSPSTIFVWEKRYNQGSIDPFLDRRGRPDMKKPENTNQPHTSKKPWSELTPAELLREIEYLQAENAYLKKLDALVRDKQSPLKTKRKPSPN
jgi:transposase